MKRCSFCGRENEDSLTACGECGTEFNPVEPAIPSAASFRRALRIAGLIVLLVLIVAVLVRPYLLIALPLIAIFYLPIYLPFLLSFFIKSHDWRGLKWSLRTGSVMGFFIRLSGVSRLPDFGDDVAGAIAGASHNFAWIWGSGVSCALVAVVVGLMLRVILPRKVVVA